VSAASVVYALCAITSTVCAVLLVRSYLAGRVRLLLWSALCFVGLAVNNVILVIDRSILPDVDLSVLRSASGLVAVSILLFGLIWESR
jgi:hydrogenase/urease accessory protein HupE